MVGKIYQEFLARVSQIETERDERLATLFKDDDQAKIAQILKDLSNKSEE